MEKRKEMMIMSHALWNMNTLLNVLMMKERLLINENVTSRKSMCLKT